MKQNLLIWTILYYIVKIAAIDAENDLHMTVGVKGNHITINLPRTPELKSVFFSTELEDECSAEYNFIHEWNDTSFIYKHDLKKNVQDNDVIRILGVYETDNQMIRKSHEFKFDEHGNGIKQDVMEPTDEECECVPSVSVMFKDKKVNCSGVLMFNEDFQSGLTKWTHQIRSRVHNKPEEFILFDGKSATIENQKLNIMARRFDPNTKKYVIENCTVKDSKSKDCEPIHFKYNRPYPVVRSSKLHTKKSFNFMYGRVVIRAQLPIGDWLFSNLILQPSKSQCEDTMVDHVNIAYSRGNRDLLDNYSNHIGGKWAFGSVVTWDQILYKHKEYRTDGMQAPINKVFGDEFHEYSMIWREDKMIFKVDGFTHGTITDPLILKEFQQKCFIVLGLTAGGDENFPDDLIASPYRLVLHSNPKAVFEFAEKLVDIQWEQPNLLIESVKVYSIHKDEE